MTSDYEIGIALGFPIHELDEMMKKDKEVLEFRRDILNVTKAAIEERDKEGKKSQALYAFPPEIETSLLPKSLEDKLDKEDSIDAEEKLGGVDHKVRPRVIFFS